MAQAIMVEAVMFLLGMVLGAAFGWWHAKLVSQMNDQGAHLDAIDDYLFGDHDACCEQDPPEARNEDAEVDSDDEDDEVVN